jgi:hypothetical protein
MDSAELTERLDSLARRFEDNSETAPDTDFIGWGQFLDVQKKYQQLGPYGTGAGLIVLALADRGQSRPIVKAQELLNYWWGRRNDPNDRSHRQYIQTLRVAFQHLALRLSGTPATDSHLLETRRVLLDRVLPSGFWGNYWTTSQVHDSTPRIFPTAMCILSFALMRPDGEPLDERILAAVGKLELRLQTARNLSLLEMAAMIAALLSAKRGSLQRKTKRKIRRIARRIVPELTDQASYFFDFESLPDSAGRIYSRDYFIISPEILLAIAGFQPGAPGTLRLMAERTTTLLNQNLEENDNAYRPTESSRTSTMDQAWTAILLASPLEGYKSPGVLSHTWYWLSRERKDNVVTGTVLPIFAVTIVTVANLILKDADLLSKTVSAVALLIVSSLYGPRVFLRLFPWRASEK